MRRTAAIWVAAVYILLAAPFGADASSAPAQPVSRLPAAEKPQASAPQEGIPAVKEETALPIYDPRRDAAPPEGIPIAETAFSFAEPLRVRPATKAIVIHHVGIPSGDTPAAAIHQAHLANGWAGIGYHYVIRKDGTIERGRPLAVVGAHAYNHNFDTVGINVTGNFDVETPTAEQRQFLERLLAALCRIYGIEPGAATIEGHRDVNSTDCPGANLYVLLPQIRRDVAVQLLTDRFYAMSHPAQKGKKN